MNVDAITPELIGSRSRSRVFTSYLPIQVTVTVQKDSYLHIGAAENPLRDKKGPVFTIQGRPVIPATSFKGAWRVQMENLIEKNHASLKGNIGVADNQSWEPWKSCIPASRPTNVEQKELSNKRKLSSCQVSIEENALKVNGQKTRPDDHAICPVCYFFGANGLAGFLRVGNLMLPEAIAETRLYDQARTRRTRGQHDGVAPGALVTQDQVEPGTSFSGEMELLLENGPLVFGKPRNLVDGQGDIWLNALSSRELAEVRVLLLKELLIPALLNIKVLGGMRSMKAGNVEVQFNVPEIPQNTT